MTRVLEPPPLTDEELAVEQEFHGAAIIAEAIRRIGEYDRASAATRQFPDRAPRGDGDPPDFVTDDGEGVNGLVNILDYRGQMATTIKPLITLAGIAAQLLPPAEEWALSAQDRWRDALATIDTITP